MLANAARHLRGRVTARCRSREGDRSALVRCMVHSAAFIEKWQREPMYRPDPDVPSVARRREGGRSTVADFSDEPAYADRDPMRRLRRTLPASAPCCCSDAQGGRADRRHRDLPQEVGRSPTSRSNW